MQTTTDTPSSSQQIKVEEGKDAEDPADTTRHQGAKNPGSLVLRSFFP